MPSKTLSFDATVETLLQGFTQQQLLNWLSVACARKSCVKCVKVDVKMFVCVNMCINVKVKVDLC